MRIRIPLLICLCLAGAMTAGTLRAQETPAPSPTPSPAPPPAPPPEPTPAAAAAAPSATYFNPAIAVIGNFLAVAGKNQVENRPSLDMRESEISFQAVVDPYARADFFVSISKDSVDLEEGFITFTHLPGELLVKAGKFRAQFGKVNTMHLHVLPWADEPLPIVNLLGGEEGWSDAGASVARLFPLPGDTFSELTVQIFRGKTDGLFDSPSRSHPSYLGQYRVYRDFGDNHNVELGLSGARGSNGSMEHAKTTLADIHLIYRWKPLQGRPYRSFIFRAEYLRSRREQPSGPQDSEGLYLSGDYQLSRRWFAGGRYEFSDRADAETLRDRGEAVTLTFWPSEFSQVRGELRRRRYAGGITGTEALLQLQFAIGAHGAHPF